MNTQKYTWRETVNIPFSLHEDTPRYNELIISVPADHTQWTAAMVSDIAECLEKFNEVNGYHLFMCFSQIAFTPDELQRIKDFILGIRE